MKTSTRPRGSFLSRISEHSSVIWWPGADDPFVCLCRTAANIRFHCDPADIVGLLCIQPAMRGGKSRLVSTVTLFNELLKQKTHLVSRLFEPFRMDLRGETKKDQKP